jgi:hypothetical protein
MPVGTVTQEPVRFELKSLPPDGFVLLRQLPYWDVLERRDQGSRAVMESSKRKKGQSQEDTQKMVIETLQVWERHYTFKNCIVDHNITDDNGVLLDFNKANTLRMLNPKVGVEIERHIDGLNSEDDAEEEDFPTVASLSSLAPVPEPETSADSVES